MTHGFRLAKAAILLGPVLLVLWLLTAVSTGADIQLKYPRPYGCCAPNAQTWGFYRTTWRRWPGEDHLAEINPRALNAERINRPIGFKTPVLKLKPKEKEPAEGAGATQGAEPTNPAQPEIPSVLPQPGAGGVEAAPGTRTPPARGEGAEGRRRSQRSPSARADHAGSVAPGGRLGPAPGIAGVDARRAGRAGTAVDPAQKRKRSRRGARLVGSTEVRFAGRADAGHKLDRLARFLATELFAGGEGARLGAADAG